MTSTVATRTPTSRPRRVVGPSTFALKLTMAVTGVLFALFVLAHMIGNLKAYLGAAEFNAYALWLRHAFHPLLPYEGLLWLLRVVLLVALIAHVGAGTLLALRGRTFRGPHRRGAMGPRRWAAQTMWVSGAVLLFFIVFHLLDLTTGQVGANFRAATPEASYAYQNLVASFSRPWAGAVYALTMLILACHLAHGLWTTAQDFGATGRRLRKVWLVLAQLVALLVALGNLSLPLAVWMGVIR